MDTKIVINHWCKSSKNDLKTAQVLIENKRYMFAMFTCHLALEKILKALIVNNTKKQAPPIHNLIRLLELAKIKEISNEQLNLLAELNRANIRARYDDYKENFYKKCTKKYSTDIFLQTKLLRKCLEKKI